MNTQSPTAAPALDVMERARKIGSHWAYLPNSLIQEIAAAITEARAAAIEECALVARSHQTDVISDFDDYSDFDEGYDSAVADITEAIRALAPQPAQSGEGT